MSIKRILVVDDSPTERHALADMLTRSGYQVTTAENGDEAIAKCRAEHPDLVLMDIVMPGTNGFQATRALTRDNVTKDIPVIICTTKSMKTDEIWGLRQGAVDYITKPVNHRLLLDRISSLVGGKH